MRAVDTNVLVRLLTADDPQQLKLAEAFIAKGAWVSHLVLAEALWVLKRLYGLEARAQAQVVEMLLAHESLSLQSPETVAEALKVFQRRPALGFSDCLIVAIARSAGHSPLGTFDRDLGKLEGAERIAG